jgi:competence protein ComEC
MDGDMGVRPEVGAPPGSSLKVRGACGSVILAFGAAAAVLGAASVHLAARESGPIAVLARQRAVVEVSATVATDVVARPAPWGRKRPEQYSAVLRVSRIAGRGVTVRTRGSVQVVGDGAWKGMRVGSSVRVVGRLAPLGGELHAVLRADTVDVFNPPGLLDASIDAARGGLVEASSRLAPDPRGLVPGIAIGDTGGMVDGLREAMRTVGMTHLTAVSGAHVAIVAGFVLSVAAALRIPRVLRVLVLIFAIAGFVLLVRPAPSVLRAAAMGLVGVMGLAAGRPSRPIPALATAVVLLLVFDPFWATALGFVLSVVATAAIVLLGPGTVALLQRWVPRWLAHAVAVPLSAQCACAPILVLSAPSVSIWAVPANLLAAPAVPLVTLFGLLAALASPVWPQIAGVLVKPAGVAAWWISAVARRCAALPGATIGWVPGVAGAVGLAAATGLIWLGGHALVSRGRADGRRE